MPFTHNPDQTYGPDMLNTELEEGESPPLQVWGRLHRYRYMVDGNFRDTDVWYFLFNHSIYLADTDEVTDAQTQHPSVRHALESLTHGRRRREVMQLPCQHDPPLLDRLHTREHRQWDFLRWWESVRPHDPRVTTAAEVNPADVVMPDLNSLHFTFDDEIRRVADEYQRRRERRRRAVPEERQADAPRWDGLPSSHSLLAQRTRRGDGSCIDRQTSAVCPPSCPCRTSRGA